MTAPSLMPGGSPGCDEPFATGGETTGASAEADGLDVAGVDAAGADGGAATTADVCTPGNGSATGFFSVAHITPAAAMTSIAATAEAINGTALRRAGTTA